MSAYMVIFVVAGISAMTGLVGYVVAKHKNVSNPKSFGLRCALYSFAALYLIGQLYYRAKEAHDNSNGVG